MKSIIIMLLLLFAAPTIETSANPWHIKTKHKTIKRMTRKQVRQAQIGRTLYERRNGKVHKNSGHKWCTVKRPTTYNAFANNAKSKRKALFP